MGREAFRVRTSGLTAAAALALVMGTVLPWFSVGPATRLGIATSGGWILVVLSLGLVALAVLDPPDGLERRLAIVTAVLIAVVIALTAVTVLRPPSGMSVSIGPAVVVTAALALLVALAQRVRGTVSATDEGEDAGVGGDEPSTPSESGSHVAKRVALIAGRVLGVGVLVVLALGFWPASAGNLESESNPTNSYDEALARFDDLRATETDIYAPCNSKLLDHGRRTDVVVVLFHGLTNCPRQYEEMADALHQAGANVLITRAPGHGIGTPDGSALAGGGALRDLTAAQLADYADSTIDIAAGLGEEVRVSGLSMGGVVSLWVAQHRGDVSRVVAIAPAMELPVVPNFVSTLFTNLFSRVPTITISHERHIDHDYAAESTNGLAATFALGQAVADSGLEDAAMVDDIVVMLNPDDPLVSEADVSELMAAWSEVGPPIAITEFDPLGLPHDLIDVGQPQADPDHVYPLVVDQLGFAGSWDATAE